MPAKFQVSRSNTVGYLVISDHPSGIVVSGAVPLGLGLNPGEDMDVCKCIVPSRHGGTLNSRRTASLLVRLLEKEERWEAPDHPPGYSPSKLG
ncbi:uncharacterized protein TNCV_4984641 [Trichonephila clavipes]|nr:uncharacterized protein TNCV_4984641 [Trichonephila clavipes]